MAGDFLARKIRGAERGACVAGNRLNVNVLEGATRFQGADQEDIQKQSSRQAKRLHTSFFLKIGCELQNHFFDEILQTAGDIGARSGGQKMAARG